MVGIPVLSFKLLLVSWITAKRQTIHNRTAERNAWNQSYDFIVIGAGTAGCVVAGRLTEDANVNVLLLEAGGPQDAINTDIHWLPTVITRNRPNLNWQYYDEPQQYVRSPFPNGRINEFMGKVVGGTSSIHGQNYNRGNRKDYDNWAKRYGAVGWSYKEVLPYFIISENNTDMNVVQMSPGYHGVGGPMQISTPPVPPLFRMFQKLYNSLGYANTDVNGRNQTGTMMTQTYVDTRGLRVTSAVYIDPNPHPNNLHIVTRALVTRILFNKMNAIGVQFAKNDISYNVYASKEVILCAGAYNSPQLLMLSGIGIRSHLESFGIAVVMDLPVGNNFANHPAIATVTPILNSSFYLNPSPDLTINSLSKRYFMNSGNLGYFPSWFLYYVTESQPDKSYPNFICTNFYLEDLTILNNLCIFGLPRSKGTIRLQSSNPYIPPRIDPNFLSDPRDYQDMLEMTRFLFFISENSSVYTYLRAPSFEDVGCQSCPGRLNYQCEQGLQCYVRQYTRGEFHPGGSCRMGDINRDDVVVDPLLRVKNINKLRVCDASIFPELPNANTAASVTMIGEKCAQFIKDCYPVNIK